MVKAMLSPKIRRKTRISVLTISIQPCTGVLDKKIGQEEK